MKNNFPSKAIMAIFLFVISFFGLIPIFLMFLNAFKTGSELASNSWGWPRQFVMDNFLRLLSYNGGMIVRSYINGLFVAIAYTSLTIAFSSLAAFAFSKYKFRGRNVLFALLLATMMIPLEITIPPLYILFSKIKWLNTYYVQIFPGIANVFCMFMLKQYMDGLPNSLLESARLDGAGHFTVFTRIMFPISAPAVGALTILTFLGKWNDYLWPQTMLTSTKVMPIMVILPTLNDKESVWAIPWEMLMAGCSVVILPLIVVFFIFQKHFMSSIVIGAVKE
ncbi:MAG: carbohydrate ABC transporter permease [Treponema sp.]|jgi:ABC-type glycerol-3-phosphate transport system permease component|nr:carbohydrate ABC transporter permease [Treponema sp.]